MSSGVRELRVWQEAVALAGDVIRIARSGVRRETRGVSDTLMTSAIAVASLIAEGYGRHTPAEQREAYLGAKRALLKLETELAVARHADLVPAGSFTELTARSAQVARLLTGYVLFLDRQVADRAASDIRAVPAAPPASPVNLGSARAPS